MRYAICTLILFGCKAPEGPRPRTFAFAPELFAEKQLVSICADSDATIDTFRGSTPEEFRLSHREMCELSLDAAKEKVIGELWIEMEGRIGVEHDFCSVRVGPGRVQEPVSPTILETVVESPVLKQHIEERIKKIDISKEYSLQTNVDGFQLDVVQHGIHIAGHQGVFVDFRLNGCAQLPDTMQEQFKQGASVI